MDSNLFVGVEKIIDEKTEALLIYGCKPNNQKQLVLIYTEHRGLESFFHIKSVMKDNDVFKIRRMISKFNPKHEVQL